MADLNEVKQKLYRNLELRLGGSIIDLELDREHYETALDYAYQVYRQRASRSTFESYTLMTLVKDQNVYTLPDEFVNVRQVFRRTFGIEGGPSSGSFDPFSSAAVNTYMLNYTMSGGLATYELYTGYVELAAKMFGGHLIYTFNPVTKQIHLVRDPKGTGEQVLIWGDMKRSDGELLMDHFVGPWLSDWTMSVLKGIIGEAREKFGNIPGPGGGTSLNGSQMKSESVQMQEKLLEELKQYIDGSEPLSWIVG